MVPTQAVDAMATFHGEIFISLDAAVSQAKRFRVTWQCELARYAIHGLLHLAGYDDLDRARRRTMKRAEDRLLGWVSRRFSVQGLARKLPRGPSPKR